MKSFRQLVRQSRQRPWSMSKLRLINNNENNNNVNNVINNKDDDDDDRTSETTQRNNNRDNVQNGNNETVGSVSYMEYVNGAFSGNNDDILSRDKSVRDSGAITGLVDDESYDNEKSRKFSIDKTTLSNDSAANVNPVNEKEPRENYRPAGGLPLKPVYTTNDYNNCAFVTLVMRDRNFCKGAEALAKSILFSNTRCRNFVCLVTPDIDRESRRRLELYYNKIVTVEYIELRCPPLISNNRDNVYGPWMNVSFTKLQCLKLFREYSKIIYLDCDSLVLQNIDHLFDALSLKNKSAKDTTNGQFYASFESCWSSELRRENLVPEFAYRQAVVPLNLNDANIRSSNSTNATFSSSLSSSPLDVRKNVHKNSHQYDIRSRKFIIRTDDDDDDDNNDNDDNDDDNNNNDNGADETRKPPTMIVPTTATLKKSFGEPRKLDGNGERILLSRLFNDNDENIFRIRKIACESQKYCNVLLCASFFAFTTSEDLWQSFLHIVAKSRLNDETQKCMFYNGWDELALVDSLIKANYDVYNLPIQYCWIAGTYYALRGEPYVMTCYGSKKPWSTSLLCSSEYMDVYIWRYFYTMRKTLTKFSVTN